MTSDTRFVQELPFEERKRVVWLCACNAETYEDFERAVNSRMCDIQDLIGGER